MNRHRRRSLAVILALGLLAAGCSGSAVLPEGDLTLSADLEARVVGIDFVGPTQMIFAPDGDLIIAELNGAENDATGRVLRVSPDDLGDRTVLQEGLDKPTGVAVVGDVLWIMERQSLSYTSLEPGAALVVFAGDLPFNGRSEGTLTPTTDGGLLYDTSGSKRGPDRVPGSATLFKIEGAGTPESATQTAIATGFKHAYAHLIDDQGQLWAVEMTDGTFDESRAADELLAIDPGDDAGWPQCVDDNRPVVEFGGTPELCELSPRSHALFDPGATPTSLIQPPWDDDVFWVALWLRGEVVAIPRGAPTGEPHSPVVVIDGIESPQHLLVDGDRVLVSDHDSGTIYAVTSG